MINSKTENQIIISEKEIYFNKNKKARTKKIISKSIIYLFLILFTLWVLIPFSIVLSTSVKTWDEASSLGFSWIPKEGVTLSGYKEVLSYSAVSGDSLPTVVLGFINTLWYVLPTTILGLFASAISAYAFAKLKFKGKNFLFSFLIMTMMIPGTIMITPSYIIYDSLGWVDTPLPLMIPGMFGAAACVFFMRQFYSGIPNDLLEAAKLDGMGYFEIFFKIMVPLSIPALLAQGILGFIGGYNDYFGPYIYLQSPETYTLQIALRSFSGTYVQSNNVVMAGTIMALIPTLIIYIVAQKYFIEGIATSGMKL
jgi:multiple sugar transport system permease protein